MAIYDSDKGKHSENRYFGKYEAIVTDNNDPDELGKVKLSVPELFGTGFSTDWARPAAMQYGGIGNNGFFTVPEIGSGVYVEFLAGNVNRPIYSGAWWAIVKSENQVPNLARGGADASHGEPKGTDTGVGATPTGREFKEPASPYNPKYPNNKVMRTSSGIVIELDDTKGSERIHIYHPSSTYIEIHPNGNVAIRTQGDKYEVVAGNYDLHVSGDFNVLVDGNKTVRVIGNDETQIDGDRTRVVMGNETLATDKNREYLVKGDEILVVEGKRERSVKGSETIAINKDRVQLLATTDTRMVLQKSEDIVLFDRHEFTGLKRTMEVLLNNNEEVKLLHREKMKVKLVEVEQGASFI